LTLGDLLFRLFGGLPRRRRPKPDDGCLRSDGGVCVFGAGSWDHCDSPPASCRAVDPRDLGWG